MINFGHIIILLYVNNLTIVSTSSLCVLFADDTNIILSDKNVPSMSLILNEQLAAINELLCCDKLSLNIHKIHCMILHSGIRN